MCAALHSSKPRGVFAVDDTAMYRMILGQAIKKIDGLEMVGHAKDGESALEAISNNIQNIHIVLLDIMMPGMNGLETLKVLKAKHPRLVVIMISGATSRDAGITIEALESGAIDFIPKPIGGSPQENMDALCGSIQHIVQSLPNTALSPRGTRFLAPKKDTPPVNKPSSAPLASTSTPRATAPPAKPLIKAMPPRTFEMVLIGVSTGGPKALSKVVPLLSENINVPILIVQHMPPMFTKSLAQHLNKSSKLTVCEAQAGQPIVGGTVYIAPGGYHTVLAKDSAGAGSSSYTAALNEDPPENSCRPAVDVLFRSAANTAKGPFLTVILTGMGEDGAKGVEHLRALAATKKTKVYSLSQSAETCVVYGMPQAVEKRGLSDEVLPLETIAKRINELCTQP